MRNTQWGCSRETVASILAKGILMLALCAAGTLALGSAPTRADADAEARAKARPVLEKLQQSPAVFTENQGQWEDASVRFAMNSMGCNVGLTSASVRFQLFQREAEPGRRMGPMGPIGSIGPIGQIGPMGPRETEAQRAAARRGRFGGASSPSEISSDTVHRAAKMKEFAMRFEGARAAAPQGEGKSEQIFHYRRGEPARWRENVPSWNAVVYRGLWEGVDLRLTGRRAGVKHEFVVSPGADWKKIRLRYEGIEGLSLRGDGALELRFGEGWQPLVDGAPFIYQDAPGGRKAVAGKYALMDTHTCAYEITGPFDPALPLVIDPELAWSTYLGGSDHDSGYGIAVDGAGNVFVTGRTNSSGWISGGFDTTYNGGEYDAFVAELSGSGAHLWSTYLGGNDYDEGRGVAVDGAGNVFVVGYTCSSGWVSGGFDTTYNGSDDTFVVRLSGSGSHIWSTYLGGNSNDRGWGIAVDSAGNVFVTGTTDSSGWVSGGFDTTLDGDQDAFVAKLSSGGGHRWSTYLGGSNGDGGYGIAVDGTGNVFVTGTTGSPGWVSGGFGTTLNGDSDAFVVELSGTGAHLWSTYLGGSSDDYGYGIAVDGAGNVFVTGGTDSPGWVSGGFDTTYNGGETDAFVAELSGSGTHLWSTYLGGGISESGNDIAVDGAGNVFVTGYTNSSWWVSGGFDTTYNGGDYDAFAAELSGSGSHLWSTYLGGNSYDKGYGIAVDGAGNVFIAGCTYSSGCVSGAFATTLDESYDAFVAKITAPAFGSLCLTITPPECVDDGAQWRRTGTPNWLDSGTTESLVLEGNHTVEFKEVPGWITPADLTVTIQENLTTNASSAYALPPPLGVEWYSYLGGSGFDCGFGIGVDGDGNVLVVGHTESSGWVSGGFDATYNGNRDAFVAKISGSGSHLWSAYLGGSSLDIAEAVAADGAGNVFVAGQTDSVGWVSGGFDTTPNGARDAFVVKLSANGAHLWSTYLGGSDRDEAYGVAVDSAGNAFVTGGTWSSGWVSGGFDTTINSSVDAFVVKLSESGAHLWSTYLGGDYNESGSGIAVDWAGNVFVTGSTGSSGWVSGGYDTTYAGESDAFVVKLSGSGAHLWSSYLGGTSNDYGTGVAADSGGNVLVTGYTASGGWVSGGFDTQHSWGDDAYVVKLSGSGSHIWSTYLGGSDTDMGSGIAVDGAGNVFVTGSAGLSSAWASGGFDTTPNGDDDAFVAKLSSTGSHLWSSYLGGSDTDEGTGIAVDDAGNVFVAGITRSSGWVSGGFDTTFGGVDDAFAVKINDGPLTGFLRVTIAPPEAVAAGVQWRRVGTTPFFSSGYTEAGISAGFYTVEFKDVPGWTKPQNLNVAIYSNQTTSVNVDYILQIGSLRVTLGPAEAVAAGALWRRQGTATWFSSGQMEENIPAASYAVEFKELTGWLVPAGLTVSIRDNLLTNASAAYRIPPTGIGMIWSTYLGGSNYDSGNGIAVDGAGNVFVTGTTGSSGWVSGGFDTTFNGNYDAFVTKLTGSGLHLWTTYLGGTEDDMGNAIAVDSAGNVLVTGTTKSAGWISGGFDTTYANGSYLWGDAFVVKLSGSGAHLWSTYLGGTSGDVGNAIAVDSAGNVFLTGTTESDGWVSGGWDTTHGGYQDAFVAKLSGGGAHLWSTYLGGDETEHGYGIALDGAGNAFVTGGTRSSGWISGGYDTTYGETGGFNPDAFVVKLSGNGSHLWSTYLGGDGGDTGYGIAVDGAGNAFVTGETSSTGWVSGGYDMTQNSATGDAFVAKLSGSGAHLWSTYLGGKDDEQGIGIAANGGGDVFVTGSTESSGWVSGGLDVTYNGGFDGDAFLVKISGSGAHLWSTYLGGSEDDRGVGIAADGAGNVYVTGSTTSTNWISDGFDTTYNGSGDAFVAKIQDGSAVPGSLQVVIIPPEAVAAGAQWRRVGTSAWLDSGHVENDIPPGQCTIEFKYVAEWIKPSYQETTIRGGQLTEETGVYRRPGIAGIVRDFFTNPVPGVRFRTDDGSQTVLTDERGQYCLEIPSGTSFSGTVRPWLPKETDEQGRILRRGYVFNPPCRTYDSVTTDTPNQDYAAGELFGGWDLADYCFVQILGRQPTPSERTAWADGYVMFAAWNSMDVCLAVREMARTLFLSQEYAQRNRTDAQFIEDCYRAFLWREPNEEELAAWLGGVWTRPEALSVFWKSQEFADGMESLFPGQRGEAARNCVAAMYLGALNKMPGADALRQWADTLTQASDKRAAVRAMALEFFGSPEFLGRNLSSEEKAACLYYAMMGRCPGSGELAYWSAMLDSGALSLEQAVDAFIGSWEMVDVLRGLFEGFRATPAAATAWEIYE